MKKTTLQLLIFFWSFNTVFAYTHLTDSLINELANPHRDSLHASILLAICDEGQISNDSSLLFIREAIKYAEKTDYPRIISMSYNYLCHWHFEHTENFDTILFHCRRHYLRMQQIKFTSGLAQASGNLGRAYLWNSLDSSMYYNLKSVELYTEAKKFEFANNAKINLANVYIEMKKFVEATEMLKQAIAYCVKTGDRNGAALSYFNLGACYIRMADLKSAEMSIRQGMVYNDTTPHAIGYANAQLANVFCGQGRYAESKKLLAEVVESGKKHHLDYILYIGYHGLAELYFNTKMWAEAIKFKKLSWDYSYKDRDTKEALYEMQYKCDSAMGNYKASMEGFRQFVAVRDSYENNERLKNADAIEAKYKNKEKQSQIELLSKEGELLHANAERQMLIRNTIIVFASIILVLSGLLFNRFKLKKRLERQQAIIDERQRISRELHDDLGAQLSTAKMFLHSLKNNPDVTTSNSAIENSLSLIDRTIKDLRGIMDDLQTSVLQDKGYIAATEELVDKINQLQQINFSLTHYNSPKRLDGKTEHHLFRITQELINNSLKYARAKNVSINLMNRESKIILMYEDDGLGFNVEQVKKGNGLLNIEARCHAVGGNVEFDTMPGRGFRCNIELSVA